MPTVNVKRDKLFNAIGKSFTDKEFDDLCFEFGIELDDITTDKEIVSKQGQSAAALSEDVVYKIEIPANRYDLLCLEGLSTALRVFLGIDQAPPNFQVKNIPKENMQKIVQKKETKSIRPFVVGAVLRGVEFNSDNFASFIDLQDKLHQNIGRKRTLVAIGTHDADTITGPFVYTAKDAKDITFRALTEEKEMNVNELFHAYNTREQCHLRPYLHITQHSLHNHPVIYDSKGVVCSLPPIINGEHSKITLNTKNVFIECTGTDLTKLKVTLNIVLAMFSQYCSEKYVIEPVLVVDEETGSEVVYPQIDPVIFETDSKYINSSIGINISIEDMIKYCNRMQLPASKLDGDKFKVSVPINRPDVLHACDIMEDIAIAYGFNRLTRTLPQCYTQGGYNQLNALSDQIREQVAQAGFNEVLTWVLVSYDDCHKSMQPKVESKEKDKEVPINPELLTPPCITLANPKTQDFQMVRTTMLPGLLKTLASNSGRVSLPIRLFEVGDIGFQHASSDVGATNQRRLGALYCDVTSGFETVQGLLDRVMLMNGIYYGPAVEAHKAEMKKKEAARAAKVAAIKKKKAAAAAAAKKGDKAAAEKAQQEAEEDEDDDSDDEDDWKVGDIYVLKPSTHPSYFPGRRADILIQRTTGEEVKIGVVGIVHPDVLSAFNIPYVCSAFELNLELFL